MGNMLYLAGKSLSEATGAEIAQSALIGGAAFTILAGGTYLIQRTIKNRVEARNAEIEREKRRQQKIDKENEKIYKENERKRIKSYFVDTSKVAFGAEDKFLEGSHRQRFNTEGLTLTAVNKKKVESLNQRRLEVNR